MADGAGGPGRAGVARRQELVGWQGSQKEWSWRIGRDCQGGKALGVGQGAARVGKEAERHWRVSVLVLDDEVIEWDSDPDGLEESEAGGLEWAIEDWVAEIGSVEGIQVDMGSSGVVDKDKKHEGKEDGRMKDKEAGNGEAG